MFVCNLNKLKVEIKIKLFCVIQELRLREKHNNFKKHCYAFFYSPNIRELIEDARSLLIAKAFDAQRLLCVLDVKSQR